LEFLYNKCGVSCPHMFAEEWIKNFNMPWKEMRIGAHVAHSESGIPYAEPIEVI